MAPYVNKRKKVVFLTAALYILRLRKERRSKRWDNRNTWSKGWILKRNTHGVYENLIRELRLDDHAMYRSYMRLTPENFEEILGFVGPHITKENTSMRPSISAGQRLAMTCRFLATGESFQSLSFSYRVGRSTISDIVLETSIIVHQTMGPEFLKMPNTQGEWKMIAKAFQENWNYPFCVGALDGKHVAIKQPGCTGSTYFNYKHFCSVVFLALVDAKYRFLYVDVGAPGRSGDAGVYASSSLKTALTQNLLDFPEAECLDGTQDTCSYHMIGDDAFPLGVHLIKPYPHRNLEKSIRIFNYRLSRARRVVENAFGILANRFRVFLTTISLNPEYVEKLILASCCLHNYLITKQTSQYVANILDEDHNLVERLNLTNLEPTYVRNASVSALSQRNALKEYFSSQAGSVPWQEQMIK